MTTAHSAHPAVPTPTARPKRSTRPMSTMDAIFIIGGFGADVVAFQQVLATRFDDNELMLWILTAGFSGIALGLAHVIGRELAYRLEKHARYVKVRLWSALAAVITLGTTAFIVRLQYRPAAMNTNLGTGETGFGQIATTSTSGPGTQALLGALLLGGLFIASTALTIWVTFRHCTPRADDVAAAEDYLHEVQLTYRNAVAQHANATSVLETKEREYARNDADRDAAISQSRHLFYELTHLARLIQAEKATGLPDMGITASGPVPGDVRQGVDHLPNNGNLWAASTPGLEEPTVAPMPKDLGNLSAA